MHRFTIPALFLLFLASACSGGSESFDLDIDALSDLGPSDLVTDGGRDATDSASDFLPDLPALDLPDVVGPDVPVIEGPFERVSLAPTKKLLSVYGVDDVVVAVGEGGTALWKQGGSWSPMESGTGRNLYAVFGESLLDLYAAGEKGTILRFDGERWVLVETGLSSLSEVTLRGAWGEEGHMFFVGDSGTIVHKSGPNWATEPSSTSYNLYSIWATSLVDVYVAAAGGTLLRRLGSVWSSIPIISGSVQLFAVFGLSNSDIWAAGSSGGIASYDFGQWSPKVSNDPYGRNLHGIMAFSPEDVWMVGEDGLVVHTEGEKWMGVSIEGPYYKNRTFHGVWGHLVEDVREAYAVGEKGAIIRFDGESWVDEPSGPQGDFHDMTGESLDDAIAVGDDGLVVRFENDRWSGLRRVTDADLYGVELLDGDFIAVGTEGAVVRIKSRHSELVASGIQEDLYGACSNGKFLAAVGERGAFYTTSDGENWMKVSTGVFDNLRDCVMNDMGQVMAVGDAGRILNLANSQVSVVPVATLANLYRVTRSPDGGATVVGDNGLILVQDGDEWTRLHEEPGVFLYGVRWFGNRLVAAGWSGKVLVYDGDEFEQFDIPGGGVLNQVWGVDEDHWYLLGRAGQIVKYAP